MKTIRKALAAAAGSAATALVIGLGSSLSDGNISPAEVGISLGGALLAAGAVGRTVWAVPNNDAQPPAAPPIGDRRTRNRQ